MSRNDESELEKVGPTAVWTAYLRSFSDIPYAQDILRELRQLEFGNGATAELEKPTMAPQYEARYKILSKLLGNSGIDQVLELAAGFTGRGLELALHNSVSYVELEVPGVARTKNELVRKLSYGQNYTGTLQVLSGNALDKDDLWRATESFNAHKQIAVINEGLMRYQTFPEKEQLACNIHELLLHFGGVWITPDISLAKLLAEEDKVEPNHSAKLSSITNKDIGSNLFQDIDSAQLFFEQLGFSVERHSLLEITDELSSPVNIHASPESVLKMNSPAAVFVMRAIS